MCLIICLRPDLAIGQALKGGAEGASLSFEVASLKLSGPKSVRDFGGGPGSRDPGFYHATAATLQDFVVVAYDVDYFQITSPLTINKQTFDLLAKVPSGATKSDFRFMFQNFLKDRFNLKLHLEKRLFQAEELVVSKSGIKIKPDDINASQVGEKVAGVPGGANDGWPNLPGDGPAMAALNRMVGGYLLVRFNVRQQQMSKIVRLLQTPESPPVVDRTGLTGTYTFALEYTKDSPTQSPDVPPPAPVLSLALEQQLGLRLISKKLPFDVVVVESFQSVPSSN